MGGEGVGVGGSIHLPASGHGIICDGSVGSSSKLIGFSFS